jgi:hypothetical protein
MTEREAQRLRVKALGDQVWTALDDNLEAIERIATTQGRFLDPGEMMIARQVCAAVSGFLRERRAERPNR